MGGGVQRYGMTVPLPEPIGQQLDHLAELQALGYTDLWSSEVDGTDAFTPLAAGALAAPGLHLGTAIASAFTRGPACLAQSAAALAQLAPGRVTVGIGASSNVIVQGWNGIPFDRPLARTRDVVRFLKRAFTGEKVDEAYDTFEVRGFRLTALPDPPPPVFVAGLRERMLRMAGEEADGAILNWLSADDVAAVVPLVRAGGDGKQVAARIFVCPSPDAEAVRGRARQMVAAYLNVPVYREFQRWIGREEPLRAMWERWEAGDRKGALAAIPDEVVDELVVHGTPEQCRAHVARYVAAGVDIPILSVLPWGVDPRQAARDLRPEDAQG